MDLDGLAQTLPNGFHDAEFARIEIDYRARRVQIDASIWYSEHTSGSPDVYREARITVRGLQYLSMDAPQEGYPVTKGTPRFSRGAPVWVDGGPGVPPNAKGFYPPVAEGAFVYWFFVHEWNGFLVICALDAEIEWKGPPIDRRALEKKPG